MPRRKDPQDLPDTEGMDTQQLREEIAALRLQLAEAPAIETKTPAAPERQLTDSDIAPPWTVPRQACGRLDLIEDGISAYCFDGTRMREFIPGQTITGVTVGVMRTVLSVITGAADQYRMNMTNRGRIVQNSAMEFDA